MAKFTPGPAVAAVSGSIGGTVFSRNKGGAYMRFRAVPTTSSTDFALNAKARLSTASQAWQTLTVGQRGSWKQWALQNPITDVLGFPRALTGHQAYVSINARRAAVGDVPLAEPPIVPAPTGLLTIVQDADIGSGDTDLTFTATPLGATEAIYLEAAVTNSPGITNVNNLMRFTGITAAAATSPVDVQSLIETRLGTLIVGQTLFVRASVYDDATGLVSLPLVDNVVVSTS